MKIGITQKHEHIVAFHNAHRVKVAKNISCGDFSRHIRIVDEGVEKVRGLGNQSEDRICIIRDKTSPLHFLH